MTTETHDGETVRRFDGKNWIVRVPIHDSATHAVIAEGIVEVVHDPTGGTGQNDGREIPLGFDTIGMTQKELIDMLDQKSPEEIDEWCINNDPAN